MRAVALLSLALALAARGAWADPPTGASPVATASASPEAAASQSEVMGWLSAGIGPAIIGGDTGFSERIAVTAAVGRNLFSLRYSYTREIQDCGQSTCTLGVAPLSSNNELALEYGVEARSSIFLATASIGLSALWITERGDTVLTMPPEGSFGFGTDQYDTIRHFTVGATWELGAYLTAAGFSFGPTCVITVDTFQSSAAILVDLHFGYMGPGGGYR
jgi:hypothetical protein